MPVGGINRRMDRSQSCFGIKYLSFFSLSVAIAIFAVTRVRALTIFADGVSLTAGWYDANKIWDGSDYNLCWAAASSNVLQWWQDRQAYVPEGIPNDWTTGNKYTSDILKTIHDNFPNSYGNCNVVNWWLVGDRTYYTQSPQSSTGWKGGYWSEYLDNTQNNLAIWKNVYDLTSFTDYVDSAFNGNSSVTLWLPNTVWSGVAHYVTLWGYEILNDKLASVWISDSDDGYTGLVKYNVNPDTLILAIDQMARPSGVSGLSNFQIGGLYVFEGVIVDLPALIPEPAMIGMIFGGLVFFVCYRRKRSN